MTENGSFLIYIFAKAYQVINTQYNLVTQSNCWQVYICMHLDSNFENQHVNHWIFATRVAGRLVILNCNWTVYSCCKMAFGKSSGYRKIGSITWFIKALSYQYTEIQPTQQDERDWGLGYHYYETSQHYVTRPRHGVYYNPSTTDRQRWKTKISLRLQ